MRIECVTIENWRSVVYSDVSFQDMTVLIGQNNHGKSNIISALLFFFGEITCSKMDFNNPKKRIVVEVIFKNLTHEEKTKFKKYLNKENKIKVRKTADLGSTAEYRGYTQTPKDDWLKEEMAADYKKRDKAKALPLYEDLPEKGVITLEQFRGAQRKYINQHKDELEFSYRLESTNFLGYQNVAQGSFGQCFFIPAVQYAAEELRPKGSSIFSQLLGNVINEMSTKNDAYKDTKTRMQKLANSLNKNASDGSKNENRPVELAELETRLANELKNWKTSIEIEVMPPDVDEILKLGTSVWIRDPVKTDIERKGQGLQRAMVFALLKAWSETLRNQAKSLEQTTSSFIFFEEPELYLHPQAQREFFSSLSHLSTSETQVVISTHSSSFINLSNYRSISIVEKPNLKAGTIVRQCQEDLFSDMTEGKKFKLVYWVNPDRGELFFGRKTILLEGHTDKAIIPFLAKQFTSSYKYDYTLIDCAGKDNMPVYVKLLNKFSLPYIVVYDKDHQSEKDSNAKRIADQKSALIESEINKSHGNSVVLVNDIEEEIGVTEKRNKRKPYFALSQVSKPSYRISRSLKKKIETIYR